MSQKQYHRGTMKVIVTRWHHRGTMRVIVARWPRQQEAKTAPSWHDEGHRGTMALYMEDSGFC
jgi:hypothetical protein